MSRLLLRPDKSSHIRQKSYSTSVTCPRKYSKSPASRCHSAFALAGTRIPAIGRYAHLAWPRHGSRESRVETRPRRHDSHAIRPDDAQLAPPGFGYNLTFQVRAVRAGFFETR